MKRILILVLVSFVLASTCFAGEYVLVEGKKYEVCREYGKNLNSFKQLRHAMVCERKLNPKFSDFKKPEWKTLDVWENRELVKKMDCYLWSRGAECSADKDKDKWLKQLKDRIKKKEIAISLARIDIDNNGKLDNVIQYDMGPCSDTDESSFASPEGRTFVIFNADMSAIDTHLSDYVRGLRFGLFIYKGRTYLDYFGGNLKFKDGELYVYDSVLNISGWTELRAKVCTYKYKTK